MKKTILILLVFISFSSFGQMKTVKDTLTSPAYQLEIIIEAIQKIDSISQFNNSNQIATKSLRDNLVKDYKDYFSDFINVVPIEQKIDTIQTKMRIAHLRNSIKPEEIEELKKLEKWINQ